jgi:SAM-dependent methyltransferase
MVGFLFDNLNEYNINSTSSMVDVGTGNGHLLFTLREEGFQGEMLGIDYSENSVAFAKSIAEENYVDIQFEVVDIFEGSWSPKSVDVVLDKGTLDAIALSGLKFGDKTAVQMYSKAVEKLLTKDSVLLITSCNFTETELESIIVSDTLKFWKKVDYPSFEFGGVKGSTICTLAFVKL